MFIVSLFSLASSVQETLIDKENNSICAFSSEASPKDNLVSQVEDFHDSVSTSHSRVEKMSATNSGVSSSSTNVLDRSCSVESSSVAGSVWQSPFGDKQSSSALLMTSNFFRFSIPYRLLEALLILQYH